MFFFFKEIFQLSQGVNSVKIRHPVIHQNQIIVALFAQLEAFQAAFRLIRHDAAGGQVRREYHPVHI